MKQRQLTLPTIGLIAGTRVALGMGLGLLLAERLGPEARRVAAWTLVAIGAVSTLPLVAEVLGGKPRGNEAGSRIDLHQESVPPFAPLIVAEAAGLQREPG
jgi:hypothetical protein